MTHLSAFVGAGFLLPVMGCVVSVPLGWDLVLVAAEKVDLLDTHTATAEQLKVLQGIGEAYRGKIIQGRPYRCKKSWCRRRFCHAPYTVAHEGIKHELVAKQK